ncbi:sodium leak channel non-selective protein [Exaiptasia diaphana]|uniref:Ion transport domain-containing protein n=1 Tax=Exaiptasia diaphana TaxID=2652724 RepID=A0A913WXY9_EXADI|nr:sodium leak channel non-selective protein [Exaiptasia diaphana]
MDPKSSHAIESDFQSSSTNLWPMKQGFFPDAIADDEDDDEKSRRLAWLKSWWFKGLIQGCAVVSVISVSMNSPATFDKVSELIYVTLILDIMVVIVFTIEMVAQILKYTFRAYLKRRNCIFNFIMVLLIWASIILQFVELSGIKPKPYTMFSIPRAPRALIMLRVFKVFVNFRLSEEVSRRSRRQIWSVIIFFAYFMTLASIIGIQMFGTKNHYCVKNSTDLNNVKYSDIPLPEARCSLTNEKGYFCPSGFSCEEIKLPGFMGARKYFDHFGYSLLTVYVSATQEGWVLVMYQMMNVRSKLLVAIYFVLLIFFLALLVKNVFIAVVSETFADLRSHYTISRRQTRRRRYTGLSSLVIKDHGTGWHLVSVDHEASKGHAPLPIRRVIGSAVVQYFIWICVFVDALIQAINRPWRRQAQFIFTILFDIEALLKIWCSGFRAYLNNSRMQFVEFVIAVGSTVLAIPVLLGHDAFAFFHVMRVIRLIGAIPGLQAFCLKIFGTGKKLGSIILLTFFFVMLLSAIGMQLFSTLKEEDGSYIFGTYTQSLESMFQILTQEGWVEVMEKSMISAEDIIPAILVACFLTLYHVFSSLIIMSVFVAVIVDNLELDEDVKIMKQHKMDEETSVTHEKLPLRIRIYERFKEDPRLVKMSRLKFASEFPTPKIRESFMRRFVNTETLTDLPLELSSDGDEGSPTPRIPGRRAALHDLPVQLLNSSISEASRSTKIFRKQSTVSALINDSNHRRTLAQLSPTDITQGKSTGFRSASRRFRTGGRAGRGAVTEADVKRLMASQGTKKLHSQLSQEDGNQRDWDIQSLREKREQAQSRRRFQEETLRENHPFFDQPLFALPRDSWFRGFLQGVVHARYTIPPGYRDRATRNRLVSMETIQKTLASQTYLEWTMVFITLASCLSMMTETLEENTFQNPWTNVFEHFFVVAMSIELGIRILADGLLFTPNAIIQNVGGVLDIFIYFNGLVYICLQPKEVRAGSGAQILMILRCLRPLRIITLMPKMKKVIMELCGGYKEILKVSALQLILMFSFAIYGVQVFSDKLARCNDVSIESKENCTGYFIRELSTPRELGDLAGEVPSMLVPRVWKNPRNFNFDDVFKAFLALVEVLSLEGWLEVRDVIRDSPVAEYAVFVHIYVLFGSMIGLTLFVGVVVTNFNEHKGIALLTVDQRRWQDLKKRLKLAQPLHLPPRPDEPGIRKKLYDVMQSVFYRRIVAVIVLLECLTLAVAQWTTAEQEVRDGVTTLAAACTLFFFIDAILKIIAYTFEGYWRSMRNRFDMLLTTLGIIWIILNFSLKTRKDMYQGCLVFGVVIIVFRFLTLSGKHNTLKMLMLTVVMSLVKSFFTIAVLVVLMMCYSLAGVILFGSVKFGEAINHNANFQTSFEAMILLFRIITGEDWNKVMHDCMIDEPYCTHADDTSWRTDCGNEAAAIVFFISFYVIVTFILLNVFVAVIIENFSLFYASDEDSYLSNTDLRDFQMAWNLVDKGRRGIMSVPQARLFLRVYIFFKQNNYLKGRLGVDDRSTSFRHMCCEIEKLRNGGDVSFHDVLGVIAYRTVDISHCLQINELLEREELEYTIDQEVAIQTIRDWFIKLRMKREREKQKKERASPLVSSNESLNNAGLGEESDREQREHHERDRLSSGEEEEKEPEKMPAMRTLSSQSAGFLAPPSSPPRQRKFSGPDRFSSPRKSSSVSFPTEIVEPPPASALRQRQRSIPTEQKENTEVSDWWTTQVKDELPFQSP